jgi:hypothetical protein
MSFEPTTAGIPSAERRTVTAFFDSREDAQSAVDALRAEGVASADIAMISGSERAGAAGEAVGRPMRRRASGPRWRTSSCRRTTAPLMRKA